MGNFGENLYDTFTGLVTNTDIFSSVAVIHHREPENGPYGGYEEGTDGVYEDEVIQATIIPDTYTNRTNMKVYGDLKQGELLMFTGGDQTIEIQDRVTFNGETYNVRDITKFRINDVDVVKQVSMSKTLDDS